MQNKNNSKKMYESCYEKREILLRHHYVIYESIDLLGLCDAVKWILCTIYEYTH